VAVGRETLLADTTAARRADAAAARRLAEECLAEEKLVEEKVVAARLAAEARLVAEHRRTIAELSARLAGKSATRAERLSREQRTQLDAHRAELDALAAARAGAATASQTHEATIAQQKAQIDALAQQLARARAAPAAAEAERRRGAPESAARPPFPREDAPADEATEVESLRAHLELLKAQLKKKAGVLAIDEVVSDAEAKLKLRAAVEKIMAGDSSFSAQDEKDLTKWDEFVLALWARPPIDAAVAGARLLARDARAVGLCAATRSTSARRRRSSRRGAARSAPPTPRRGGCAPRRRAASRHPRDAAAGRPLAPFLGGRAVRQARRARTRAVVDLEPGPVFGGAAGRGPGRRGGGARLQEPRTVADARVAGAHRQDARRRPARPLPLWAVALAPRAPRRPRGRRARRL
jgi:predicted  nucleic acid-binding Zn-ribbon protein